MIRTKELKRPRLKQGTYGNSFNPPFEKWGSGGDLTIDHRQESLANPGNFALLVNFVRQGFPQAPSIRIYELRYPQPCSTLAFFLRDHLQHSGIAAAPGGSPPSGNRHAAVPKRHPTAQMWYTAAQIWYAAVLLWHKAVYLRDVAAQKRDSYRNTFPN
jgi:hypothetical protein